MSESGSSVGIYVFRYPKDLGVLHNQEGEPVGRDLEECSGSGPDMSGVDEVLVIGNDPEPVDNLTDVLHKKFKGTVHQGIKEIGDKEVSYGQIITEKTHPKRLFKIGPYWFKTFKGLPSWRMKRIIGSNAMRHLGDGIDYGIQMRRLYDPKENRETTISFIEESSLGFF